VAAAISPRSATTCSSPTGEVTPAFHITDKPETAWPAWDKAKRHAALNGKATRSTPNAPRPSATPGTGAEIEETFATEGNGNKPDGNAKLIRTVTINGRLPANAWYRLGVGMFENKDGAYILKSPKSCRITADGAQLAGSNLVIPSQTRHDDHHLPVGPIIFRHRPRMKRLLSLLLAISAPLFAADPVEADYYKITTFQTPKETALEVGSIELLPDGRLVMGTRRG
jgi:hypothetical protein